LGGPSGKSKVTATQGIVAEPTMLRIVIAVVLLFTTPLAAEAQQATKVPRIGVVFAGTPTATALFNEAFKQGLREHGYVEGHNLILERRYGEGRLERTHEIAAELVRMKVDVIVTASDPAIVAAKRQTRSIPIVMVGASDPVGTGFVASLARPGGNITGTSRMSPELSPKRLELLREAIPQVSRVAVVWNPDVRGALLDFKELEGPARSLRIQLQSVEVSRADDFPGAFAAITEARAQAMILIAPNPVATANRDQLVGFAQKHRLPCIYGGAEFVDVAGGLMAYGEPASERWRRAAMYVDKILKGASPSDLPVEQPTKFDLVINLKAAKAIGLTIPPSLLRRADRVIQ
jgi:putative tryptophan/tyrosine transport system substrate-binding protein